LLVSVFSIHITSPKAHREEADLSGLDGDDNDDSGMDENEAEAKAFEEIKRIFGLSDDFKKIPDTLIQTLKSIIMAGQAARHMLSPYSKRFAKTNQIKKCAYANRICDKCFRLIDC
jgi:hypothetical protein